MTKRIVGSHLFYIWDFTSRFPCLFPTPGHGLFYYSRSPSRSLLYPQKSFFFFCCFKSANGPSAKRDRATVCVCVLPSFGHIDHPSVRLSNPALEHSSQPQSEPAFNLLVVGLFFFFFALFCLFFLLAPASSSTFVQGRKRRIFRLLYLLLLPASPFFSAKILTERGKKNRAKRSFNPTRALSLFR